MLLTYDPSNVDGVLYHGIDCHIYLGIGVVVVGSMRWVSLRSIFVSHSYMNLYKVFLHEDGVNIGIVYNLEFKWVIISLVGAWVSWMEVLLDPIHLCSIYVE